MRFRLAAALALVLAAQAVPANAADEVALSIVIQNHVFSPTELKVPAGKVIVLIVDNRDATAEEFESPTLKVEKIIAGGSKGLVRFGPLTAGTYGFFGDFNRATAQGKVTAE
jgi:hypothetical protein